MADHGEAPAPREKALLDKYAKGKRSWKKKVAQRIALQFLGRYSEERDAVPDAGGDSDGEKGEARSV